MKVITFKIIAVLIAVSLSSVYSYAMSNDFGAGQEALCKDLVNANDVPFVKADDRIQRKIGITYGDAVSLMSSYANLLQTTHEQKDSNRAMASYLDKTILLSETLTEGNDKYDNDIYRILCEANPEHCRNLIADYNNLILIGQNITKLYAQNDTLSGAENVNIWTENRRVLTELNGPGKISSTQADSETTSEEVSVPELQASNAIKTAFLKNSDNKSGNTAFSKDSLNAMLGYLGLAYDSVGVMHIEQHTGQSVERLNEAQQALNIKSDDLVITSANNLWVDKRYESAVKPTFIQDIKRTFKGIEPGFMDVGNVDETVLKLNNWVEEKTKFIKDVITKDMISDNLVSIFISTLYFKGSWDKEFEEKYTKKKDFITVADGVVKTIQVDTMNKYEAKLEVAHIETGARQPDIVTLRIPFKGKRHYLYISYPASVYEGLGGHDFVASGDPATSPQMVYNKMIADGRAFNLNFRTLENVNLSIPRFEIENKIEDIHSVLKDNGYGYLLKSGVLNNFTDDNRVYLAFILQAVKVRINEKGGEAAAATVGGFAVRSLSIQPANNVKVNTSFAYAIVDQSRKEPIFEGIVTKPEYNDETSDDKTKVSSDPHQADNTNLEPFNPSQERRPGSGFED